MKRTTFILSFLFLVLSTAKDWLGYRGPIGMGVIQAKAKPPLHWDAITGENILWQVPLPLGDGTDNSKNADRKVFFVNYSKGSKEIGKVTTNAEIATWNLGESERG